MQPSIFTRIINGEIPCHKIYEDEKAIAFLDLHPINPGHVLVVPKLQVDQLWDLSDDDYQHLWTVVKSIGSHIKNTINCPRVGVVVEGFEVSHVHVHLIPIYHGEDLKKIQNNSVEPDNGALNKMAKKLEIKGDN